MSLFGPARGAYVYTERSTGEPILLRVINRVKLLQGAIIATSINPRYDLTADFRGSEEDVSDRYGWVAKYCKADVIIENSEDKFNRR